MCGRFTLFCEVERVSNRFGVEKGTVEIEPRYNIAPTEEILGVVNGRQRRLALFRWGLIPFWAEEPSIGNRMINARVEAVSTKPAFRRSLKNRRCLIVADGFYEWRKEKKTKVPMYIRLTSHEPFGFASLWDEWTAPQGEKVTSCTIITIESNALISEIHPRMPVILTREAEDYWLDDSIVDPARLLPWLKPYPSEEMEAYEVDRTVNSSSHKGPDCVEPVG